MKKTRSRAYVLGIVLLTIGSTWGATTKTVKFDTSDAGEVKSISDWGEDATWVNYHNAKKSAQYAGSDIDFVRIGFYLHKPYNADGSLSSAQTEMLDKALAFADMIDSKIPIMLSPNNEKGISDWYKKSGGGAHIERWYHVMLRSKEYVETRGHKVISIEVFNEPDWKAWNMGHKDDLDELLEMCEDWGILRVGPSTLSSNQAEPWYDKIDSNVDVGSTHTINGTMDQYIDFIDTVKRDKKTFMNPEVHALVEVIVGAEEGIDSACWWDQINNGRAHFMRACQGQRLAYVPVEKNWSAACVYRGPDGILYGFASTNERNNGVPTNYKFVCKNEDVTYCMDGDPQKETFRKKGESFFVEAKVAGKGKESITRWFTIVPGNTGPK